jgi:hypothetical protein
MRPSAPPIEPSLRTRVPRGQAARLFCLPLVLAALAALPTGALGQASTGSLEGRVVSPVGDGLPGVEIVIVHRQTGLTRSASTNETGAFAFPTLPVGSYDLTARSPALLQEVHRTDLAVRLGASTFLDLSIHPVEVEGVLVRGLPASFHSRATIEELRFPERVVERVPVDGRNFMDFILLAPGTGIAQGPDGDAFSISGQRGIFNNVSVDGSDFNNPFFGEQRGGQRPAFTFNQDAIEEIVVSTRGATPEFGRAALGFVNVLTKSGTNEWGTTAHYYGQFDQLSAKAASSPAKPDFRQHQFGFTLGGPLIRDRAFLFLAYDQQEFTQTKQQDRIVHSQAAFDRLLAWSDTAFDGSLRGDFSPVTRTNDAKALLAKFDWNVYDSHRFSLKYSFTDSEQRNGTFDVDTWAASANALELDRSHALSGSLHSHISSGVANEIRFQWAREERPRHYSGPTLPGGRPFPDTAMEPADGFRFGMPFFIPVEELDRRIQLVNNVSILRGDHRFKVGAEWNRTTVSQTFLGFANGRFLFNSVDGFLDYLEFGPTYVQCSDGSSDLGGQCPPGTSIVGPLLAYLQFGPVPPVQSTRDAGTQRFHQDELAVFVQDTWRPSPALTVTYGVRWEAQIQPQPILDRDELFYGPFLRSSSDGRRFPSDGTIPSDWTMVQPRAGIAWEPGPDGRDRVAANIGVYHARLPALIFASSLNRNGSIGQNLLRSSGTNAIGIPPPAYPGLVDMSGTHPDHPDVFVTSRDLRNPRTLAFSASYERGLTGLLSAAVSFTHARTDHLFRFVNRNDAVLGSPFRTGLPAVAGAPVGPADTLNGIGALTTLESSARSRYNGVTLGASYSGERLELGTNYTLGYDRSDDDNERDPFSFRYARADRLDAEFGYSDRDQRHRLTGWAVAVLGRGVVVSSALRWASAQPMSEKCGLDNRPTGERAARPSDRICPDGTILKRNTLRRDNAFLSLDARVQQALSLREEGTLHLVVEAFNLLNIDNFKDPPGGSLLFNFDGTLQSGLGDPFRLQVGVRYER